jgi:hypothetical protein
MTERPKPVEPSPGSEAGPARASPASDVPRTGVHGTGLPVNGRPATGVPGADRSPRPLLERIGLAFVALVLGSLFGAVAAAAWFGGEVFLAAMGAIGCAMTLWVGGLTLFRG